MPKFYFLRDHPITSCPKMARAASCKTLAVQPQSGAHPTTRITIMAKGNNAHKKEVKKPKKEKPKPAPAGRKS